jgi:hypothetical protein
VDWKYALHLPLHPPVIQEDALCEFRRRLFDNPALLDDFQNLIAQLLILKPSWSGRFQELKSEEVLRTVCSTNYASTVREAIHRTLEVLAVRFPEWLKKIVPPQWYGRYTNLASMSLVGNEEKLIEAGIADINHLLQQIHRFGTPALEELEEVCVLGRISSQYIQKQSRELKNDKNTASSRYCNFCPHKAAIVKA